MSPRTSDAELVVNVRGGARLCVPADVRQYTPYVLLEQEDWFEDEIRFVRRFLREGMQAVDVGASYGVYTVAMARAVGAQGRVWAFEPTPQSADYLSRSLELNGLHNVRLRREALSDSAGSFAFGVGVNPELNALGANGPHASGAIEVRTVTLDQVAAAEDWRVVDFMKLDVEGHELEVIQGGRQFLSSASPLLMLEIKAAGKFDLRALRPLTELGYRIYHLLPGMLVLAELDTDAAICPFQLNVFACKPDRAARLSAGGLLAEPGAEPLGRAPRQAWLDYARAAPYASVLHRRWPAKAGSFFSPHRHTYAEGLAAFALSRDPARSAAERVAWLRRSDSLLAEAQAAADTLARRISYARAAWELARRHEAVNSLRVAVGRVEAEAASVLREPFLAPSERQEKTAPTGELADWLKCLVLEQFEKLQEFSSCFRPEASVEIVEWLVPLPQHSPEIDRRRQLIRMVKGLQQGPQPVHALLARSEDNLNPQYWAAAPGG
jgi:protein O-GlcNAc transferase